MKEKTVKDAIYHCPNCEKMFPGIDGQEIGGSISAFVNALQVIAEADLKGCHVQFEIERAAPQ